MAAAKNRPALAVLAVCVHVVGFAAWSCRSNGSEPVQAAGSAASTSPSAPSPRAARSSPEVAPTAPAPAGSEAERAESIVILAGGDVDLGRGTGQRILRDPSYDPFRGVAPLLAAADLRIVNQESPLSDQHGETAKPGQALVFTGPPGGADVLARAGIDAVSLANNHIWDYGKKAMLETLDNLDRVGVAYAGVSRQPNQQYHPRILRVKGWKIALFSVTHIWNQPPIEKHEGRFHVAWAAFYALERALARAREENDLVLIAYHGGAEYVELPMQWTRDFVRAAMRARVDAIIGHHPHVPHGVGWFGERPVFYSLGNLVFGMHRDYESTGMGFFARLTFHRDGRREVEACPYHILASEPVLFAGSSQAARERLFESRLARLSLTVGGTSLGAPGRFSCVPLTPPVRGEDKDSR